MVATNWNWDNGEAPIHWIIRQKHCDIATALEVFELTGAFSYRKCGNNRELVPESAREAYDLAMEIRNGLDGGVYTRSEIAYDGERQMYYLLRRFKTDEEKAEARLFYPRLAGRKISGRTLQTADTHNLRECQEMLSRVL